MTQTEAQAFETIRTESEDDGALRWIVLNQPKANVLSMAMMLEIGAALEAWKDDPDIKLVAIRGEGRAFSFGASVAEHTRDRAASMLQTFHAFCRQLAAFPTPVAAVVDGPCLGGAFELALCCHLVFATERATFACPEIKLGVFPPVLAAIGHLRLGGALAERLLLTGGNLKAPEAASTGWLAGTLTADEERPLAASLTAWYDANLAGLSAYTLRQAVKVSRRSSGMLEALGASLDRAEAQYLQEVVESFDGNEGIEAFLERRPTQWKNA